MQVLVALVRDLCVLVLLKRYVLYSYQSRPKMSVYVLRETDEKNFNMALLLLHSYW